MEETLLSTETQILEVSVDNDSLRLTNKRLICNGKFIGINELRGATVTVQQVTTNNREVPDTKVTKSWCFLILTIVFSFCIAPMMHPYKFVDYFAIFAVALIGAVVFGSLIATPVHLLLNASNSLSSKTEDMVLLTVEKTDNSYFVNQYYSLGQLEQLRKFEREVNTLIFK